MGGILQIRERERRPASQDRRRQKIIVKFEKIPRCSPPGGRGGGVGCAAVGRMSSTTGCAPTVLRARRKRKKGRTTLAPFYNRTRFQRTSQERSLFTVQSGRGLGVRGKGSHLSQSITLLAIKRVSPALRLYLPRWSLGQLYLAQSGNNCYEFQLNKHKFILGSELPRIPDILVRVVQTSIWQDRCLLSYSLVSGSCCLYSDQEQSRLLKENISNL